MTWTRCSALPTGWSCFTSASSLPRERRTRSAPTNASGRSTLAMLEVKGLSAGYGRAQVLHDMSFAAREGEVIALVGRNSAGKSTTLKAMIGLVPAWSGEIRFDGRPVQRLESYEIARRGLAYVPEERRIFSD